MYCRSVILCLLNCITESIQVIVGCILASPDVHNTRYRFARWYQRRVQSSDMTSQKLRNVWRLSCLYVEYFHKTPDILHNALQCEPQLILVADYISHVTTAVIYKKATSYVSTVFPLHDIPTYVPSTSWLLHQQPMLPDQTPGTSWK